MMIREKTSVFELPKNLARQVPVDEVNSPFLQGAYTASCGAIHGGQQNVTKHAFLSDMLKRGATANSMIFPTSSVSIVARWFAAMVA
jgi:hypothetical protein